MTQKPPDPSDVPRTGGTLRWNEPQRNGQPAELGQLAAERPDNMLGRVLRDTYRIVGSLDEGGMGRLYRAEHLRLRRPVAVKFMARNLAATAEGLARFRREAENISQLDHPHVVNVLDFDTTAEGEPFIVLELLIGAPLSHRLAEAHQLPLRDAVEIVFQISSGLSLAHKANIVHRDLKPDNIFMLSMTDQRTFVKLLDFGISSGNSTGARLTGQFDVLGTPDYMAPEQAADTSNVDHRADQWSLACIAYEMLTGQLPFPGESVVHILSKVRTGKPIALVEHVPTLPLAVQDVILRALSKDPELRFSSIGDFAEQLAKAANVQLISYGPHAPPEHLVSGKSVTLPAPPNHNPHQATTKRHGVSAPRERRRTTQKGDAENRIPTPKIPVKLADAGVNRGTGASAAERSAGLAAQAPPQPPGEVKPATARAIHARLRAPGMAASPATALPKVESGRLRRYSRPKISSERPVDTNTQPRTDTGVAKAERTPEAAALRSVLATIKKNVARGESERALANARTALKMAQASAAPELNAALAQAAELLTPILLHTIGGPAQVLAASIYDPSAQDTSLSPQHMFLLSRIGSSMTIEELLDITPFSVLETLGLVLDFIDQGYLVAQ